MAERASGGDNQAAEGSQQVLRVAHDYDDETRLNNDTTEQLRANNSVMVARERDIIVREIISLQILYKHDDLFYAALA